MAAVLFAAGTHGRYMLPNSELMLHEPLLGNRIAGNASSIRSVSESLEKTKHRINALLAKHTGKTLSIAEPRLLYTNETSLVITLSKRRLFYKYAPVFRKRGYQVWDMNFINPTESNVAYDPLAYIRTSADIRFLAESIVKADPNKWKNSTDPFWDQMAISLLCAEIGYVMTTRKEKACFYFNFCR